MGNEEKKKGMGWEGNKITKEGPRRWRKSQKRMIERRRSMMRWEMGREN